MYLTGSQAWVAGKSPLVRKGGGDERQRIGKQQSQEFNLLAKAKQACIPLCCQPHSIESRPAEPTADVLPSAEGNLRPELDHLAEGMP